MRFPVGAQCVAFDFGQEVAQFVELKQEERVEDLAVFLESVDLILSHEHLGVLILSLTAPDRAHLAVTTPTAAAGSCVAQRL